MEKYQARKTIIDALVADQLKTIENGVTAFVEIVLREGFTGFEHMSNAHLVNAALGMGVESQSSEVASAVSVLSNTITQTEGEDYAR